MDPLLTLGVIVLVILAGWTIGGLIAARLTMGLMEGNEEDGNNKQEDGK